MITILKLYLMTHLSIDYIDHFNGIGQLKEAIHA